MDETQAKLIAQALNEVRILLASHLGSQSNSPTEVRVAAHLAYALHNQALAVMEGKSFSIDAALKGVRAVDRMFGEEFEKRFASLLGADNV